MALGPKGWRVLPFGPEEVIFPFLFHALQQSSSWVVRAGDVQAAFLLPFLVCRPSSRFISVITPSPLVDELRVDPVGAR
eukprot:16121623-Heterocapsa_arctica.AAC.1